MLVFLQISSFFMLKTQATTLLTGMFIVGLNLVLFMAMIPYAKWVWKLPSYQRALLQVAKHELILLGLSVVATLLAMLMTKMRIST